MSRGFRARPRFCFVDFAGSEDSTAFLTAGQIRSTDLLAVSAINSGHGFSRSVNCVNRPAVARRQKLLNALSATSSTSTAA